MARLRRPYKFANSGNYPGTIGTTAWSGLARQYSPTDAELADGATPDTSIAAEAGNYLEAIKADALTVQNHEALTTWKQVAYAPAGSLVPAFLIPVPAESTFAVANLRPKTFIVSGVAGGTNQGAKASADLQSFEITTGVGAFGPYVAVAADDTGKIFGGIAAGSYKSSANGGQTYAAFAPGVAAADAVYYTGAAYLVVAAGQSVAATALTGAWSAATTFNASAVTKQLIGNRQNGSVATHVVALARDSGTTHYLAYTTSTNGGTWALGQDFGAATANITFSEAWGLFVVLTSTGELWTSPDGAAWTKQKTAGALTIDAGFAKSCALGDAIVAIVNHQSFSGTANDLGVAYTFDLGATWYETYFGDMTAASLLHTIVAANGRLYACDDTKIYISGVLESPASPLYLGV